LGTKPSLSTLRQARSNSGVGVAAGVAPLCAGAAPLPWAGAAPDVLPFAGLEAAGPDCPPCAPPAA
jgi:hypothetical protein